VIQQRNDVVLFSWQVGSYRITFICRSRLTMHAVNFVGKRNSARLSSSKVSANAVCTNVAAIQLLRISWLM